MGWADDILSEDEDIPYDLQQIVIVEDANYFTLGMMEHQGDKAATVRWIYRTDGGIATYSSRRDAVTALREWVASQGQGVHGNTVDSELHIKDARRLK